MTTYKIKLSTIQFKSLNELMDAIVHLDRVRLTNIDYKEYVKLPRLTDGELQQRARDRFYAESTKIEGLEPIYSYDNQALTLDIHTDGGLVAAMIQQQGNFFESPVYVMDEYFNFLSIFQRHAINIHPIQAIYETYENGRLVSAESFNVAEQKTYF